MTSPSGIAAVVFTVSEAGLRQMDVALGPCVPLSGRKRPLCSPLMQDGAEAPRHTASLYTVLTQRPADDALVLKAESAPGRLFACSDAFVEAMADANEELQRLGEEDDRSGDKNLPRFAARHEHLDRAWLAAADWPSQLVGTGNRLHRLGLAMQARRKGQQLWCWYGPAVPMRTVVSGHGAYPGRAR